MSVTRCGADRENMLGRSARFTQLQTAFDTFVGTGFGRNCGIPDAPRGTDSTTTTFELAPVRRVVEKHVESRNSLMFSLTFPEK